MIDWWGPVLYEYYAATEANGITFVSSPEWLERPGTVGRAGLGIVRISDDEGKVLAPYEVGTIYFERDERPFEYHNDPEKTAGAAGLVYFAGGRPFEYHNDPEKTASVTNDRGWRTLGDIGYLDTDGYLYLTDRQANMIISGGVNIYPQEAENVLAGHPSVVDVAVIGVPDPEMGEAVKAVVQLVDGVAPGPSLEAELLAFCRGELATYKCPRTIDFVDDLPRHDNGKLYKRLLRERYWEGHDSRVI
jgi:fatty-acyl-CoA synthase